MPKDRQTGRLRSDFGSENSSDDGPDWIVAHRELSRLEDEVEAAAMEMTIAPLTAIPDVIALLRYIEDFSQENESGFLLWPEIGPAFDGAIERPWAFAILENLRLGLEAVLQEKNTERR